MEGAEPARPKMKLKIQKVAAKSSSSAAAPASAIKVMSSTDTDAQERLIGVLRGPIELHASHCSGRGQAQADGRCCSELHVKEVVTLVRKPFGTDPCALKIAVGAKAIEVGFIPNTLTHFLSPLIDTTELRNGIACSIDGSTAAPSFTLHINASPATVRRGADPNSPAHQHWVALAKALGRSSVDDLLKN